MIKKFMPISAQELASYPAPIVEDVMKTLKAYSHCGITFANGEYHVSTGVCIMAVYPSDHKVHGNVYAEDVYTEDERIINYVESFHGFPVGYRGNRDYNMLREVGNNWQAKFTYDALGNIVRA